MPDTLLPLASFCLPRAATAKSCICFWPVACTWRTSIWTRMKFLNVERIPFTEMVHRVMDGEIEDAKTIAAVLKTKVLLNL